MSRLYIPIKNGKKSIIPDFSNVRTISGNRVLYYLFYQNSYLKGSISFPVLTSVRAFSGMFYIFSNCSGVKKLLFPSLITLEGSNVLSGGAAFCTNLEEVDFSKLEKIDGSHAVDSLFYGCTSLKTVSFNKLNSVIGGSVFYRTFYNSGIKNIYFNAFTSDKAQDNITNLTEYMLQSTRGCTVHFPSNLQAVISSYHAVTVGFGGTNTTILFDLPATS